MEIHVVKDDAGLCELYDDRVAALEALHKRNLFGRTWRVGTQYFCPGVAYMVTHRRVEPGHELVPLAAPAVETTLDSLRTFCTDHGQRGGPLVAEIARVLSAFPDQ